MEIPAIPHDHWITRRPAEDRKQLTHVDWHRGRGQRVKQIVGEDRQLNIREAIVTHYLELVSQIGC